jgi:hypothetical protein
VREDDFVTWDLSDVRAGKSLDERWMTQYSAFKTYREEHGHSNVSIRCASTKRIWNWVNKQRASYRKRKAGLKSPMTEKRIQLLDDLHFPWDLSNGRADKSPDEMWMTQYNALKVYHEEHGHSNVSMCDPSNRRRLWYWVNNQRIFYWKHKAGLKSGMTEQRIKLLEDIDFTWEIDKGSGRGKPVCQSLDEMWMTKYNALKVYREEHGHSDVPQRNPSNISLWYWVYKQRATYRKHKAGLKSSMTEQRIQLLEDLNFTWEMDKCLD